MKIKKEPYHPPYPIARIAYTSKDIQQILKISSGGASRLLRSGAFPVVRVVRNGVVPIQTFHIWLAQEHPDIELPEYEPLSMIMRTKNTYTVTEIRYMLGIGKTASYEFVKLNKVETVNYSGDIRVTRKSFEDWFYANQSTP